MRRGPKGPGWARGEEGVKGGRKVAVSRAGPDPLTSLSRHLQCPATPAGPRTHSSLRPSRTAPNPQEPQRGPACQLPGDAFVSGHIIRSQRPGRRWPPVWGGLAHPGARKDTPAPGLVHSPPGPRGQGQSAPVLHMLSLHAGRTPIPGAREGIGPALCPGPPGPQGRFRRRMRVGLLCSDGVLLTRSLGKKCPP